MCNSDKQFETWFAPQDPGSFSTVQSKTENSPTAELYADFDFIRHYLTDRHFAGSMPPCVVTFNRRPRGIAYIGADTFENIVGETAHELSFNIAKLRQHDDRFAMSVVACALVGVWRQTHGPRGKGNRPPTKGYCDRSMASKMEEIGLVPSDTGTPDGKKRTGYGISYYIAEGGPFDLDARELLATGFRIRWRDHPSQLPRIEHDEASSEGAPQKKATRVRFECPECEQLAWAKATAVLECGVCHCALVPG